MVFQKPTSNRAEKTTKDVLNPISAARSPPSHRPFINFGRYMPDPKDDDTTAMSWDVFSHAVCISPI